MEELVFGSKVLIMVLLAVLSIVNGYNKFVSAKPRRFLGEGLLIGGVSAVSFLAIAASRGLPIEYMANIGALSFLVFFVFHVFMEFSGFNQGSIDPSKLGGRQQKLQRAFRPRPATYVFVILGSIMAVVALINRDMTKGTTTEPLGGIQLGLESLMFGTVNALPTVMLEIDRGEKNGKKIATDTAVMGAAFAVGHLMLQLGGFYTAAFR